jgi:hypothetical protein
MNSFMLLTPHTTKNIGADNTKQAITNTTAVMVWMQWGATWKRKAEIVIPVAHAMKVILYATSVMYSINSQMAASPFL